MNTNKFFNSSTLGIAGDFLFAEKLNPWTESSFEAPDWVGFEQDDREELARFFRSDFALSRPPRSAFDDFIENDTLPRARGIRVGRHVWLPALGADRRGHGSDGRRAQILHQGTAGHTEAARHFRGGACKQGIAQGAAGAATADADRAQAQITLSQKY
jgi:hypothetical protein